MSWRNTYFEMEQPKLYSLNDGQFAAQYRNGYHTTVEHIFDSAALQIRRTDTPHQYELRVQASQHSKCSPLIDLPGHQFLSIFL
ncbi:hypothetical protein MUCCIDRAFT_115254 [Mucor lusitanicus CBS 277.49]|uniref:Vid27 N-terminal domain-containing protein n=1 Tax=Mucor lusitanicus CBS 277.49 TaxID=747725 RepID=A0A168H3T7_MUCCL|nr:hypothetical protein MUCCIDRAFT_115254 [Mucor lusitanicus CBS 277.49]